MGRSTKAWVIGIGAAVAALAVFATNIDKILTVTVKWLGPYLAPYIGPQAHIAIRLDDAAVTEAHFFVADPANELHALATSEARHGEEAVFSVPANVLYKIGWQGPDIETGAVKDVLAVQGTSAFRLVRLVSTGQSEGIIKVTLRPSAVDAAPLITSQPSANLVLSAHAVSVAREPAAVFGAGALPELDRAVAVVGLFATGTTDCARKVFDLPAFATRSTSPDRILVGCLGMPVPLRLAELVDQIDGGDAHRLDGILGDDAPAIRMYAKDWRSVPFSEQIRRAIDKLTTTAEFWIAYQSQVLTAYARAVVLARQCGLVSERGRLLIFDRLNQSGLNPIARAMRAYSERYPANSPDRPTTERARILALGDIFKEYESSLMSLPSPVKDRISRRIDTIVSGKGTIRGISFDLNELGISDSG